MMQRVRVFQFRAVPARTLALLAALAAGVVVTVILALAWIGSVVAEHDYDMEREGEGSFAALLGLLFALVVFGLCAAGLRAVTRRMHHPRLGRMVATPLETEQCILALAKQTGGGPMTIPEVALHCRISLADSKAALSGLAEMGFAHVQVTDHGDLAYVISGLLPPSVDAPSTDDGVRRPRSDRSWRQNPGGVAAAAQRTDGQEDEAAANPSGAPLCRQQSA